MTTKSAKLRNPLKLAKEESGQSLLEYILLTSLVGIFCLIGVKTFGGHLKTRIEQMNKQITKHVKIG
ncbi:MAG: hypothetical protein VXV96_02210 [Bdellovibrionota bacterium]|nr:hypothetical protein [Bdellovibrionota bacterium]